MKISKWILVFAAGLLVPPGFSQEPVKPERQWPQYRGYQASGILDDANLPESWSVPDGRNVRWKVEVPGLALSCPVIWGDYLFLTTAIGEQDKTGLKTGIYGDVIPVNDSTEHEWKVYCYDKN